MLFAFGNIRTVMDRKINILIVDDEQIVIDSIKKHLRNQTDYHVCSALSVNSALALMDETAIDIILTDLMMPDIDGLEFLKLLQEKKPDILAIMITGYATINSALQATQLGAFDYLAKPFTRDELRKIVRRAADLVKVAVESGKDSAKLLSKDKVGAGEIKGIGQHSWMMKHEDGTVLIGMERPLLYSIGKIQTVYLPAIGDELRQGSVYFQIFSADLQSKSLLSPLSGIVLEVNEKVIQSPNETLQEPYSDGWLLRIEPTNYEEEIKLMGL